MNPETRKMVRDQQKMGMTMIYKEFGQRLKLTPEQTEKFNDLLADHIMDNVDRVTTVLRDKLTPEQMTELFAAQDATLREKVQTLLGPEGLESYQDYSKNLLSSITAEQFKTKLTGTAEEKEEKAKRLSQVLQEEAQAVLSGAGPAGELSDCADAEFQQHCLRAGSRTQPETPGRHLPTGRSVAHLPPAAHGLPDHPVERGRRDSLAGGDAVDHGFNRGLDVDQPGVGAIAPARGEARHVCEMRHDAESAR